MKSTFFHKKITKQTSLILKIVSGEKNLQMRGWMQLFYNCFFLIWNAKTKKKQKFSVITNEYYLHVIDLCLNF